MSRIWSCRVAVAVVALISPPLVAQSGSEAKLEPLPQTVPSPKNNPTSTAKVELGRQLFFDPRLSGDNKMSCATCHLPEKAFGDGLPTGKGAKGKRLARNTQTVLDTAFYRQLFWDGRAASLEEQALGPIQSPDEMAQDLAQLEVELNRVDGYVEQFRKLFGTKVTRDGIAKALAAFQRTLVSGPTPLDRYLRGEKKALSKRARRGLELFTGSAGCVRCHNGPLLSDGKFYRIRDSKDAGRFLVTKKKADRKKFRTPSLRNIARTAPYMHDGSLKSLEAVVSYYYREVPDKTTDGLRMDIEALSGESFSDIDLIVAFLAELSSEVPKIKPPKLPK